MYFVSDSCRFIVCHRSRDAARPIDPTFSYSSHNNYVLIERKETIFDLWITYSVGCLDPAAFGTNCSNICWRASRWWKSSSCVECPSTGTTSHCLFLNTHTHVNIHYWGLKLKVLVNLTENYLSRVTSTTFW